MASGRISDVAVDPRNRSVWYVGVSSGGVWKTLNRGTTRDLIFDDYTTLRTYPVTLELRSAGVSRVLAGPLNLQVVSLGRMRNERVKGGG